MTKLTLTATKDYQQILNSMVQYLLKIMIMKLQYKYLNQYRMTLRYQGKLNG